MSASCDLMDCSPPGSCPWDFFRQEHWSGCHFLYGPKMSMIRKIFLRKPTDSHKSEEYQFIWRKKKDEATTNQGGKVGHSLGCLHLCLVTKVSMSPYVVMSLCNSECLSTLRRSEDGHPQTPLIPYHHIPSACLIGEDSGVKRIKTLLMCGCAYQRFLHAHLHFAIMP